MKKFLMGFLAGTIMMLAGTALADTTTVKNLIGKVIDGQYPVSVDGETLTNPAIVVDGTSFLPVRQFGESVGYAVYFDPEGDIRLEKQDEVNTLSTESTSTFDDVKAQNDQLQSIKKQWADVYSLWSEKKQDVKTLTDQINQLQASIDEAKSFLLPGSDNMAIQDGIDRQTQQLTDLQSRLTQAQADLDTLEQQKSDLEAEME